MSEISAEERKAMWAVVDLALESPLDAEDQLWATRCKEILLALEAAESRAHGLVATNGDLALANKEYERRAVLAETERDTLREQVGRLKEAIKVFIKEADRAYAEPVGNLSALADLREALSSPVPSEEPTRGSGA